MDPSDNASIETLRPKSVPEGLIALGTITQVLDTLIRVQITGGINCIIEQTYVQHNRCFKKGQQYVCKIVKKRPRKGYANADDIIATLDPSSLQEDNLPKTLLSIPHVPLQCAVQSIEDHGYQMDIGFRNMTGFLNFDVTNGKKLIIGQIVRCCSLRSLNDGDRVVPLTMDKDHMKKSEFSKEKVSKNVITEKCILPGSKSFLTVMKVLKNGLIVNFMNEFAGFVDIHHLKEEWHIPKRGYKISDQLKCTVLYYNNITRMFALSTVSESKRKKTLKHFIESYHVGKVIKKCRVAYLDNSKAVYFKIENVYKGVANVQDCLDEDVQTLTKDEVLTELDSTFTENSPHKCRIKSLNLADLVIVLSRRQEFLDLPCVSLDELKPNDRIEVTVKKYIDYGIIVTFGLNYRALILNEDLKDFVTSNSHKKYPIGEKIWCRVLRANLSKQPPRIYLTNKHEVSDQSKKKPLEGSLEGASTNLETPLLLNENSISSEGTKRERIDSVQVRERKIRTVETSLMDPETPSQSVSDFKRLILLTVLHSTVLLTVIRSTSCSSCDLCSTALTDYLSMLDQNLHHANATIGTKNLSIKMTLKISEMESTLKEHAIGLHDSQSFFANAENNILGLVERLEQETEELEHALGESKYIESTIDMTWDLFHYLHDKVIRELDHEKIADVSLEAMLDMRQSIELLHKKIVDIRFRTNQHANLTNCSPSFYDNI